MAIDLDVLKSERDKLKEGLREVEGELRKLEAQLKVLRQREIQTKREIEAVSTLIDIKDTRDPKPRLFGLRVFDVDERRDRFDLALGLDFALTQDFQLSFEFPQLAFGLTQAFFELVALGLQDIEIDRHAMPPGYLEA